MQNSRIQDGCHHQVNQIELVYVRVRVEGEWFRVNLREENKMSEFHNAEDESKMEEFKMAKFKMATIIKLSLRMNEWSFFGANGEEGSVSEVYFCANGWKLNLGKYEWVWEKKLRWLSPGCSQIQDGRIQDGWHHQVEWEWMCLSQNELVWVRVRVKG